MNFLEERILKDGQIRPGNILKVDSFLNHQLDIELLEQVAEEFFEKYSDRGITKILTVEASGIPIAVLTAQKFHVPAVFAKKEKTRNLDGELYTAGVRSYTHGQYYTITMAKKYLKEEDHVLLVDDFMALGSAMDGLLDICEQAGAKVEGIGIAIEKGFQGGGDRLRAKGLDVTSLAIVDSMTEKKLTFRN